MMKLIRLTSLILMTCAALVAGAADKHMGVATCASTVCHGNATEKPDANILHSEYVIWGQEDPHAHAYRTLQSLDSKRIAEKLGIGPAEKAPVCLACHSDWVPEKDRGKRFQLSDGIGCEGCHGAAENWLKTHTDRGVTHADNVAHGLVPLEHPQVRAEVCQKCHIGGKDHFAGHDIMGAGHPRLQFELANYSAALPQHYRIDADYRQRKQVATELQMWSEGRLKAALNMLDGVLSERFDKGGMWPDLAFFDCHACHQPMAPLNWQRRSVSQALPPGTIRLNDSALLIVDLLWRVRDSNQARNWDEGIQTLHRVSRKGVAPTREVAQQLRQQLVIMLDDLHKQPLSDTEARKLVREMVGYSRAQAFNDYMTAEQITMALNIMLRSGAIGHADALQAPLSALYDSLDDQNDFKVWRFRQAMDRFSGMLR